MEWNHQNGKEEKPYFQVIESVLGYSVPRYVFGELFELLGVLGHRDYSLGHEFLVMPDRHLPRLYPHEVVESEL